MLALEGKHLSDVIIGSYCPYRLSANLPDKTPHIPCAMPRAPSSYQLQRIMNICKDTLQSVELLFLW